jgi:hypothetical protein
MSIIFFPETMIHLGTVPRSSPSWWFFMKFRHLGKEIALTFRRKSNIIIALEISGGGLHEI